MKLKEKYENILDWFAKNMPVAESELDYTNPFELLVAVAFWPKAWRVAVPMYWGLIWVLRR